MTETSTVSIRPAEGGAKEKLCAIVYDGHDRSDDLRWAETGAPDIDTYRTLCGHVCGMA